MAALACAAILASMPALADPPATGTAVNIDKPYQARFVRGVEAMMKGDYALAAAIFEKLLADTGSQRVRLELARTLFLARRFEESRQLFNEVLAVPDLPWQVAENIRRYLDEIDMAIGYVKFSVGLVSDSNPRNFTSRREVMIGGQVLTLVPPDDNDGVTGIRWGVRGYRPLDKARRASAFFTASYTDFPQDTFDRTIADAGLMYTPEGIPWLAAKIGGEGALLSGDVLYYYPYMGAMAATRPTNGFRLRGELKLGALTVPDMPYLDANSLYAQMRLDYPDSRGFSFANELTLEASESDEDAYSYRGAGIGARVVCPIDSLDLRLPLSVSYGMRRYEDQDPIFGERRKDILRRIALGAHRPSWRVFGYRPQVNIVFEDNASSIGYYSYQKLELSLQLDN